MPYKYNILGQGWHFPQENISSSDIIKFQGRINAYYSSDQELQTDIRNVYLPFFFICGDLFLPVTDNGILK